MEQLSRKQFLTRTGAGLGALAGAGIIAGCGSSAQGSSTGKNSTAASASTQAQQAAPRRGGVLKVGYTGGGSSDTLNPLYIVSTVDYTRVNNLFDPLAKITPAGHPELYLAEEFTPNKDATLWTIRVKSGVTFHNGKELTADDLVYTFQQTMLSKVQGIAAPLYGGLDAKGIKKRDKYTISIPFTSPLSFFYETVSIPVTAYVIPVGFDPKKPVGTGPFKANSFTPGTESVFDRNENYWVTGKPYIDQVVITDYSDETTQASALESGQIQGGALFSADVLPTLRSQGIQTLISKGGGFNPFTMRTDVPPFNDVRVRQAMRLIVNRPQMNELVFAGNGVLGNDIFGIWAAEYDHAIPQREQDIPKAKALLKAAGQENLSVQMVTSDIAQGSLKMAQVLAQQASAAGVTINLKQVPPSNFFGPNYLHYTFAQDFYNYNYYFTNVAEATVPTGPYNETHFNNPRYTRLYQEAAASTDEQKRIALAHEMQMIDYTEGGMIIPFFVPIIDGYQSTVHGDVASKEGWPFNRGDFKSMWLS